MRINFYVWDEVDSCYRLAGPQVIDEINMNDYDIHSCRVKGDVIAMWMGSKYDQIKAA